MERLGPIELVMLLLVVATALAYVARRIGVAYPILLVLGGLALGGLGYALAPDLLAEVQLDPDLVFLLFLPPILFGSGYLTPIRDLKANARPIGLLAIGLVLFTTVVVGVVVSWLVPEHAARRGLHARGHRRAAGRGGRDGRLAPARRAAARRDDPRGREPDQRRVGAHRVPGRDRRWP